MRHSVRFGSPLRLAVTAAVTALALGCGPGSKGYRVSGRVTFKGQPVPVGKIYFTPDAAKGNVGPTGYADITDGVYDTAAGGMGSVGGAVVIEIEGFDPSAKGEADKSGEAVVKALFPRYAVTADLPKANGTKDVDVPADAAKGQPSHTKAPVHTGP